MADKVSREVATAEVDSWLDFKKVSSKKRETHREHIDNLVDAIVDGSLTLSKDKDFIHDLKFPIEGEESLKTLTYKPRLKVETVQMHLQGVKSGDNYGAIHAYIAALTTKPKTLIKVLDTEDYAVAYGIAIFFM